MIITLLIHTGPEDRVTLIHACWGVHPAGISQTASEDSSTRAVQSDAEMAVSHLARLRSSSVSPEESIIQKFAWSCMVPVFLVTSCLLSVTDV